MSAAHSSGLSLRDGLDRSGLTPAQLWVLYVGVGGCVPSGELVAQIERDDQPGQALDPYDHNVIAQALNEHFVDLDQDHPVGYREDPEEGRVTSDLLPGLG